MLGFVNRVNGRVKHRGRPAKGKGMMRTSTRTCAWAVKAVFVGIAAMLWLGQAGARGATFTWTGGSAVDGNWNTAANWSSAIPVSANDTDLVFSTNTNGLTAVNNIANLFAMRSMTFNAGLPAFVVGGSSLSLNNAPREIFQNSSNPVAISGPLWWGQSQTMNVSGSGTGDLSIGTLAYNDQGYFRLRSTAAFDLNVGAAAVPGPRTADIYNDMPAGTGKQITIGNVSFTNAATAPTFGLSGVGRTEVTGQLIDSVGGGGRIVFGPGAGGTVLLSNPAGAFNGTIDGTFQGAGTIDLGGATQAIRDLVFSGANATNGTVAVRNFYLDYGTVNIQIVDGTGYNGNLTKRDVTNNDSWINTACTHTGVTRLIASDITLQNNGTASQSSIEFDVVPRNGEDSRLILSNAAVNNADRISDTKPVTMNGGLLVLIGNGGAATLENMGPVSFSRRAAIQVDAAAGGVASLTGDSLTRSNYGTFYVGGDGLGAAAGNVARVQFDTAPAMTAGTPGTTSAPVVPWATGYASYSDNWSPSAWFADMLTYDAATGFRPLAVGEYILNNPAGGAGANNRIATSQNLAGADVAMKSLAMVPAANGTYTLGGLGGETLTVTDGVIVSGRSNQGPANVISVTNLTFGPNSVTGYEGIIHSYSGQALTINSNIIDNAGNAVSLTKAGPHAVTLRGTNAIGGTLRINEGAVTVDGSSSTTVNNIVIDSILGGSLDVAAGSSVTTTGTGTVLYIKRPLNQTATSGGGTINLSGDVYVTYSAVGTQSQTTLGANMDLGAVDRAFTVDNGPSDPDLIVTGAISGSGGLVKAGAGQLALRGANTYSGATTIPGTTAYSRSGAANGSGQRVAIDGATGSIAGSSAVDIGAGALLVLNNASGANNDRIGDVPVSLGGNSAILRTDGNGSAAVNEHVGTISYVGQDMIALNGAGGGVTRLVAAGLNRVGHAVLVVSGDSLGLAAAGNVTQLGLDSVPALVGSDAPGTPYNRVWPYGVGCASFTDNIADWGARDAGRGTLLTYDTTTNSFRALDRTTEFVVGVTAAGSDNANINGGGGSIAADKTIQSFTSNSGWISGVAGTQLTITSGLIDNISGYDPTNITVPYLTFGNATTGYEGLIYTYGANGTSANTNISSVIRDNGGNSVSLTIGGVGPGAAILSGASTYTGDTTVAGGVLKLNSGDDRLPTTTPLTVHAGGSFDLNNYNQALRGLDGDGAAGNSSANLRTLTLTNAGAGDSFAFDGVLGGALSLVVNGPGTQVLGGASTYVGDTIVNGGLLAVTGDTSASHFTVNTGGTLGGDGSITVASGTAVTVADGGRVAPGWSPSTGTLTVGSLFLNPGSFLDYELTTAGVFGDGVNDALEVLGDLTLDGTLNLLSLPAGTGQIPIISYAGTLTDLGLDVVAPGGTKVTVTWDANTVYLNLPVPEPGVATMLSLFAGLALWRRRGSAK